MAVAKVPASNERKGAPEQDTRASGWPDGPWQAWMRLLQPAGEGGGSWPEATWQIWRRMFEPREQANGTPSDGGTANASSPWAAWIRMMQPGAAAGMPGLPTIPAPTPEQLGSYLVDAWQRHVLFLDVLRQRGNARVEQTAMRAPNVLTFGFELVMLGADLPRPCNYALTRIVPPKGVVVDPRKRPFIIFDPRAGHGPGVGGMKRESEIGMALASGHPCYFVGFTPDPVHGQTIEDVCRAEAAFVRKVSELHPECPNKPVLIGNCQAGWQILMMAAIDPEACGPIVVAGSPLSYWNGKRGQKSLRYLGGLLGGSWLTSLASDLGAGKFDGAFLVQNFESMNPANTLWSKPYNVWSKIDTEAERFLDFERWWGMPVTLEGNEIQTIVDDLFIGNKLTSGRLMTSDGTRIDLRNITSPIVVFCSEGDDITPPQQALGWILDLYDDVDDIISRGQTIIYSLHQSVGHLGIFVSTSVARREHAEFTQNIDLIDSVPPGLYEAVIEDRTVETKGGDLVSGDYVMRLEPRTLAHIRALGGNSAEDDWCFATAQRVSEINQGLYRTFLAPFLQATASEQTAAWLRSMNPYRARFEVFSDKNPFLAPLAALAEAVRAERRPVEPDNPMVQLQQQMSKLIVEGLERYTQSRDRFQEELFFLIYGSRALQAAVGLRSDSVVARQRVGHDPERRERRRQQLLAMRERIADGGLRAAALRALLWVSGAERGADERTFASLKRSRASVPAEQRLTLAQFKQQIREQQMILRLDETAAIQAIPAMLGDDMEARRRDFEGIKAAIEADGEVSDLAAIRLRTIERMFLGEAAEKPQANGRRTRRAEDAPST